MCVLVYFLGFHINMVDYTDIQLLLRNKSHEIRQPFSRAGDGLHSQVRI